jgi:hypothetical protein
MAQRGLAAGGASAPPLKPDVRLHMAAFHSFEMQAIRLMAGSALSEELLSAVLAAAEADRYEYTGCGYFLTVKHPELPAERHSLSEPPVAGTSGDIQAGFVVYLGDHELTLECHTWGAVDVPADFRDRVVSVQTPPVNSVDLRNAT